NAIRESQAKVEKVIAESENLSSFWRLLTVRYSETGMFGEAFEAAKKALSFNPNDAGLYYLLGVAAGNMAKTAITETTNPQAARKRWLETSESAYQTALQLDPKNYRSMYGIAVLYVFELDNPEQALPYLEKYLAIQEKDVDAFFLYGRALYAIGRLQDAVNAYGNAAKYTIDKEKRQLAEQYQKTILDELYGSK
ncbi:MAG TPA: tetratricopeptide repeat protein, partial [Spirochaetales bacterium]|nr:tetratricopeptide repeat protein [Spirochaetales bacterium]